MGAPEPVRPGEPGAGDDPAAAGGPVETFDSPPGVAPVLARSALGASVGTLLRARGRGDALPPARLRLAPRPADRERLTAYQRLVGAPVSDVLPPAWPHLVGFPLQAELMARREFPLPLLGLVHLENAMTVHRALTASDPLEVTVSAAHLRDHPRGRLVDLVTEARVEHDLVWEGRSTYLSRGTGDPDAPRGTPAPTAPSGPPSARWRLPGDLGRRYAAVSGDVNPIHLHPLSARALGFPRAIAHGMWTCAATLAVLGPRTSEPGSAAVWFRAPVLLPGTVDLVLAAGDGGRGGGGATVAALRSGRDRVHLVLRHTPRAPG